MKYNPTIGIEVHAQLLTQTKLFCGCPTRLDSPALARRRDRARQVDWKAPPNTLTCPVCLGMPGTLPVINKKAVELAIKAALALNCKIEKISNFARKNYFYPDLPKGYQITQYEHPLSRNGFLPVSPSQGGKVMNKKIRIRRVHLEEDAGKLFHEPDKSLIDFNRCGVPLIEIVTEPDIGSSKEAYEYLKKLRQILRYLNVCTGDMEKGHFRCEPNISINYGTRTEIKNLNSFKAVEKGIEFELKRQAKILESGKKVKHVTLLWDEKNKKTQEMRSKEKAEDYRYFPEPDLPPLIISQKWIEDIKKTIPELPDAKVERFIKSYKIKEPDAKILCEEKELADYYEVILRLHRDAKLVTSFITEEFLKLLHEKQINIQDFTLPPEELAGLFNLIKDGTITRKIAKDVFPEMVKTRKSASLIVKEKGLKQVENKAELEKVIKDVLKEHPAEVDRYKKGKFQLLGFFIGEVMRKTGGKANPKLVNQILKQTLQ
ncbi:Asp-tRNA(Asn)/Glu-tRNA(Gln) amidotransferase subunit GatB [candidate division WOR-3 bacterium]|nr:Asp-tRNA(Asn)/Glu-tRNA(Gln) amidotransferase subunit GatB [candidate division WOR-3 bacterium]